MKRISIKVLALVMTCVFLFTMLPLTALAGGQSEMRISNLLGDVNQDGIVDMSDTLKLNQYCANLIQFDAAQKSVADVNGDGQIDMSDTLRLNKYCARILPELGTTTISLNQSNISLLVDGTTNLVATFSANPHWDSTVTWTSSNNNIATVDANGKIVAKGNGVATVTATIFNGQKATCQVAVSKRQYNGIDVSKWQGDINWATVKNSGRADFAMIRSSYGWLGFETSGSTDSYFTKNVTKAQAQGIPVGAYHFSYATTPAEARLEAQYMLKTVAPYNLEYPLVYDFEDHDIKNSAGEVIGTYYQNHTRQQLTDIAVAFCEEIEAAGRYVVLYGNKSWLQNRLNYDQIKQYDIWLAHYTDWDDALGFYKPSNYDKPYSMWQCASDGRVPGISGKVDIDVSYKDYEKIINGNGGGGGSNPEQTAKVGVCNGNIVNVRTGPSTGYSVVFQVAKGNVLDIIGEQNGWYKISCVHGVGYIRKDFVDIVS